jgi:hypothetical protein
MRSRVGPVRNMEAFYSQFGDRTIGVLIIRSVCALNTTKAGNVGQAASTKKTDQQSNIKGGLFGVCGI